MVSLSGNTHKKVEVRDFSPYNVGVHRVESDFLLKTEEGFCIQGADFYPLFFIREQQGV